jgi:23S rRNA pseudouridine955/2504/2580 synthase
MEKRYLALVEGKWEGKLRRVDAPLLKNTLRSGERVVTVSDGGKSALSLFKPVTVYSNASLVEVGLLTGRTHQIRVHATSIGCPIAGDEKYGDEAFNQSMKKFGLKRLFLHAESVVFQLSASEKKYRIKAPLSAELQNVLNKLKP